MKKIWNSLVHSWVILDSRPWRWFSRLLPVSAPTFVPRFVLPFLTICFSACAPAPAEKVVSQIKPAPVDFVELEYRPEMVNGPAASHMPYVILISIDGYRYDYNQLFHPPHIEGVQNGGVAAEALIPVYPSKTFPNHYSLVTGLYPDRHGIVSNEFYDPDRKATYSISDRQAVEDGSWYLGDPLWVTIEKQGYLTASCFWVGSEADIQGMHPNYYFRYNKGVSNEERVQKVLSWLALPAPKRPHFITLYFDQVDLAAHNKGTHALAVKEAVQQVDAAIGQLQEGIQKSGLPVDVVLVSDHGMEDLDSNKTIVIDQVPDVGPMLTHFIVVGRGPQMALYLKPGQDSLWIKQMQNSLMPVPRPASQHYRALRRDELASLHYSKSPRVGDIVILPEIPYSIGLKASLPSNSGGNHGWEPRPPLAGPEKANENKNMLGIFYASGPDFKKAKSLPAFENIHVYPLVLKILGLKAPSGIDGKLKFTQAALAQARSVVKTAPPKPEATKKQ